MKKIVISGLLTLAFPVLALAGSAEKGRALYAAKCQSCHGEKGDGNGPVGKALKPKPTDFTDAKLMSGKSDGELTKTIKDGGRAVGKSPLMAAFGSQLKDEEISDILAYIRTFAQK